MHGDVLVATSVLPGLHEKYPDAVIDWYVRKNYGTMLVNNPHIRDIIQGPVANPQDLYSKYDLVIRPDHHDRWNKPMAYIHCEQAEVKFHPPQLYFTQEELDNVEPKFRNRILVANDAGWRSRECPNLSLVLQGLAGCHKDLLQVSNKYRISNSIEWYMGKLRQVAAIMYYARLYIGVDTVFMHMAVALGKPMILFLGPTGPETQYIPRSIFLRPFVHLNPAVIDKALADGIPLPTNQILETIRKGLNEDGTVNVSAFSSFDSFSSA